MLVRPGVDLVNGPGRSDPTTTANTKNPVTGELLVFCYVVNGGGRTVPFPDLMYPAVPLSAISAPSQLIALGEMSDSNPAWLNVMSGATINYTLLNDRLRHENPGGAALLLFLDGHTALMKPDTIEVRNICWEY
ncbi:MAG: hypothetical protein LBK99_15510 [Opitutaceae bacterium]|nr:hypothetical protein [Opitutaceae bacterium]